MYNRVSQEATLQNLDVINTNYLHPLGAEK
jgi:hypothetical protein